MKKLYSPFCLRTAFVLLFMLTFVRGWGQTTFFTENMGTATVTTEIAANTFQNASPVIFSGTADVRSSSPSDYPGASLGANVMVNANNETFLISGINTSAYGNITLSLGQRKGANAANNELKIEVSEDGTNWTLLSYTRPTGSGTANWAVINPTGTIPSTPTLSIRFTGTNTTEWRIDDVKLTGTASATPTINVSSAITGLDYTVGSGPSAPKTFTVTGTSLTANIDLTTGGNFDISTSASGTYTSTLSVAPANGTTQTFYARLRSGLSAANYLGDVTVKSTGAADKTISLSGTVSPVVNYTLTYDGNGNNTGTPPSTQSGATSYTVEGNPGNLTRFGGYYFMGWTINSNGSGTPYGPGDASLTPTIALSANTTLYARYVYAIIYLGNGSTGGTAPAQQTNYNSLPTTISGAGTLVRAGYTFAGWNTAADGSGVNYAAGSSFTPSTGITQLHAQWVLNVPVISTSGAITAMTTVYGTPSTTRNFSFTANYLTGTQVVATAPAGFQVATASGGTYGNTASYAVASGSASGTVYIRLAPTTSVGPHAGNVTLADNTTSATASVAVPSSTVTAKVLTITGLTGNSKVYDGTVTASVTGAPAYAGLVNGETFPTVLGTVTWAYPDANVGNGKILVRTGDYNAPSANYTVTQPTLTASITAKPLTISAPAIASKVYNTFAATGAIIPGTLSGLIGTQTLTVNATGTYADANAAIGKTATVTYVLGDGTNGGFATNYSLANGTGTGDITKATPTYTPTIISVGVNGDQTIPSSISNSPGTLSFVSNNTGIATVNATSGVVTGVAIGSTTVNVTQVESPNYIAGSTSVNVNVSAIAYLTGDYRTTGTGNWVSAAASPAIWERLDSAGNWNASNAPNYNTTNNVYIRNGNVITATGSFSNGVKLKVMQGGIFQMNSSGTAASVYVYTGGEMRANGALTVNGTFDVEDNASVYLNADIANPGSTIWLGTENFRPQSNFYIWNWRTGQYLYNNNISANSSGTVFGNLYIDTSGGVAGNWNLLGPNTGTITLTSGDLVFNSGQANIRFFAETGSTANVTIKGNLKLNSGWAAARTLALSTAGVINLTVDGNVVIDSPGALAVKQANTPASGASLTVKGNLEMNGPNTSSTTKLHLNAANVGPPSNGGGKAIINLYKNLLVGSNASITNSVPTADVEFNFVGSTKQTANVLSSVSGSETDNTRGIPFYIKPNSFVELTNDLTLSNGSRFVVENNGTLDFGFTGLTPHIIKHGTTGNSAFVSQTGSILRITSPLGLSTTGNIGNVQVTATAATRDFSSIGTFHYIGKANQITGNALSTSSEKNVIVEMNADNLELRPSATFGITNTGVLDIRKGKVVETETEYVTGSTGTLRMAPATYYKITKASTTASDYIPRLDNVILTGGEIELASIGNQTLRGGKTYYDLTFSGGATKELSTGTSDVNGLISILSNTILDGKTFTVGKTVTQLLMDSGSRFKTGGNGAKPDAGGTYVLAPTSTIEFQGDSATKIKVTPQYENVDVSGTNVETGGKNFIVNNLLKVTDATAVLTVPEVFLESETPFVVTAKKGIQIVNGGKAIFKNNANLLQDIDATNVGNITMERKATVPSTQYNYWASPVENQSLYGLYAVPANSVKTYNSTSDLFNTLPSGSTSVFGKGYSIKGPTTATVASPTITATFVGKPNNESTAGVNTITLSTEGRNFNLIGNPYPSNLDLVELYNANVDQFYNVDSTTPTVFLWDNTGNTELTQLGTSYSGYAINNYATVNLPSGLGAPATRNATTGKIPNGIVRPGQGFIMRASETATNLVFKNNQRTSAILKGGKNSQYFKGAATASNDNFWLRLTTSRNMNIVIALSYHPEATNNFERFDSSVLNEAVTENFYSLSSDSKKLAIQSRKGDFNTEDVIPLAIKISENGIQKISIEDKTGVFSESQNIYLRDKVLNKVINLSTGDYTFSSNKGTDDTRFEIVYKDNLVLGTDVLKKSDFVVYKDGLGYVINSTKSLGKIEVYDAAGRLVLSQKTTNKNIKLDATTLANGLYIIKTENSGDVKTNKILK